MTPSAASHPDALGDSSRASMTSRLADRLPGWMFLTSGLALFAAVVLTPPWLALREDTWKLQVMQAQSSALATQTQRYQLFDNALRNDDPVVLERLALTHLRLGVKGKLPLWVRPVAEETGDVGAWLSVAQPQIGQDLPAFQPLQNRLTRIVTGSARPALAGISLLLIVAGVLFNPRSVSRSERLETPDLQIKPNRTPRPVTRIRPATS